MITSNVTTITLDGKEKTVVFDEGYPYFWITNKGSSDIYVSLFSGIVPKTDGVYTIAAGSSERIGSGYGCNKFYILGTGEAYIRGERIAAPPSFKKDGKGGGENKGLPYIDGIIGYFDVSTVDVENNKWRNQIKEQNDIDLPNGFTKSNNAVILDQSQYGAFQLPMPSVVYAVFKCPAASSDAFHPIVTKRLTSSRAKYGFDIYLNGEEIIGTAIDSDISSGISGADMYHCACIASIGSSQYLFYVDGILQGTNTFYSGYYSNEFLINKVIRGTTSPDPSCETYFKALLFGTQYHDNIKIAENSKFLLNNF